MFSKLLDKYKKIPGPVKASLWFTLCNVTQKGISLLSTPIFTRLMSTEEYGVYTIYQSWYQIISIFATLNLFYGVFNNGMTKYPDDRNAFTSAVQGLSTVITILLFGVYQIAPGYWNGLLELDSLYVNAMFAELLFVPAFNYWAAKERYDYKYVKLVIVTIIMAVGSPLLGIIAVLNTTHKAEARVLAYVFVQVCIGLIFFIYNIKKGRKLFIWKYWKFALLFNIPLIPHYLSSTILNQVDRIMISRMIGKGEAAIYSVAYNVATMMTIIITAINNSFTPYMYKSIQSKQYSGIRKNSKTIVVLVGFACVAAMALGPEIIAIFASKDYYDAIWVVPPVACAVYFKFLYPLFGNVEFYFEKTGFVMIASCAGALANVVLNYIFIPIYGYYAAGYTTLVCYIIYSFAHYLFQRRILKTERIKEPLFDMRFLMLFSLFIMGAMCLMIFLYPYKIMRYVVCVISAVFALRMFKQMGAIGGGKRVPAGKGQETGEAQEPQDSADKDSQE